MQRNRSILLAMPPTRFRGMPRVTAAAVVVLTLLAILALAYVARGYSTPVGAASADQGDLAMYGRIVDHMRDGQDYYTAAHAELLHGAYGTRSVFNWRLPALPWLASLLPSLVWAGALLRLAAFGGLLLAFRLLDRTADRATAFLVIPALALNLVAAAAPGAAVFTDVAAGVLILVSASAYGLKLPGLGFIAALLALFIRELAAPYVVICIFFAWRERRPAELWAWLVGLVAFGGYFAWHYLMVQAQLGPGDIAYPQGWVQFGGLGFVLSTAAFNGLLLVEPLWASAILLPLCLLGLVAWRDPAAWRVGVTVGAYLVLFTVVGKRFDDYWGALYTPLMMLGLPFVPAAARDLVMSLRDGRGVGAQPAPTVRAFP